MKRIKFFSIAIATTAVLFLTILSSCKKDFFDLEDTTGIDSRIWNDAGAVELFLNRTYNLVIPLWPTLGGIHNTSDEMNTANTALRYSTRIKTGYSHITPADIIIAITIVTGTCSDICHRIFIKSAV